MKPPRSVWVLFEDGWPIATRLNDKDGDLWVRYDLHRPKKRKARKGERSKR